MVKTVESACVRNVRSVWSREKKSVWTRKRRKRSFGMLSPREEY